MTSSPHRVALEEFIIDEGSLDRTDLVQNRADLTQRADLAQKSFSPSFSPSDPGLRDALRRTLRDEQSLSESAEEGPRHVLSGVFFPVLREFDFRSIENDFALHALRFAASVQRDLDGNIFCFFRGEHTESRAERFYKSLLEAIPLFVSVPVGFFSDDLPFDTLPDGRFCYRRKESLFSPEVFTAHSRVATPLFSQRADSPRNKSFAQADFAPFSLNEKNYFDVNDIRPGRFQLGGPAHFYGRETEVHQFREFFSHPLFKEYGGICLIEGPPGVGKSRFAEEAVGFFIEQNPSRNVTTLRAAAFEEERILDYSFIRLRFLPALLQALPPSASSQIPPELLQSVQLFGESPGRFFQEGFNPYHLVHRLLRFLLNTRKNHALVMTLDDLQWADRESAQIIAQLFASLDPSVLILVPARSDVQKLPEVIRRSVPSAKAFGKQTLQLSLENLPLVQDSSPTPVFIQYVADSQELDLPPTSEDFPFAPPEYLAIAEATEGNPYFLDRLLQSLIQKGFLEKRRGKVDKDALLVDHIPRDGFAIMQAHLQDRMTHQQRTVLQWVVALSPCDPKVFLQVLPSSLHPFFTDFVSSGVIYAEGAILSLEHSELGRAVEKLYPNDLKKIAADAAVRFYDRPFQMSPSYLYKLARRGNKKDLQEFSVKDAVAEALRLYQPLLAQDILRDVLRSSRLKKKFSFGELEKEIGTLLLRQGRYQDAYNFVEKALSRLPHPAARFELCRLRREILYMLVLDDHSQDHTVLKTFFSVIIQDQTFLDDLSPEIFSQPQKDREQWSLDLDTVRASYRDLDYPQSQSGFARLGFNAQSFLYSQEKGSDSVLAAEVRRVGLESFRMLANILFRAWQEGLDDDSLQRVFFQSIAFQQNAVDALRAYRNYIDFSRTSPPTEPTSCISTLMYAGASAIFASDAHKVVTSPSECEGILAEGQQFFSEAIESADSHHLPYYQALTRYEAAKAMFYHCMRNPRKKIRLLPILEGVSARFDQASKGFSLIGNHQLVSYSGLASSFSYLERAKLSPEEYRSDLVASSFASLRQSYAAYKDYRGFRNPTDLEPESGHLEDGKSLTREDMEYLHFAFLPQLADILEMSIHSYTLPSFVDRDFVLAGLRSCDKEWHRAKENPALISYRGEILHKRAKIERLLQQFPEA